MADPIHEIIAERERARERGDPLAEVCYLVTIAAPDRAEARALTLRDITERGVGVLISRTSPKWEQVTRTETAAVLIHWPTVRRQYRIWGPITPMEPERIEGYWRRKGLGSMLLEHYYTECQPQSSEVPSRDAFLAGIEGLRRRFPDREAVPRPASLTGIYIVAREIEAWHGSEERLHDRRRYRRAPEGWEAATLVP